MTIATCDLCDTHKNDFSGDFRVLPPVFRDFGGLSAFSGPVATAKCHEDNSHVKAAVDSPGLGRVLVVDGGGSLRRALVGGNLAAAAARNGRDRADEGVVRRNREIRIRARHRSRASASQADNLIGRSVRDCERRVRAAD
jgi:regulator of ribonuclease activity A